MDRFQSPPFRSSRHRGRQHVGADLIGQFEHARGAGQVAVVGEDVGAAEDIGHDGRRVLRAGKIPRGDRGQRRLELRRRPRALAAREADPCLEEGHLRVRRGRPTRKRATSAIASGYCRLARRASTMARWARPVPGCAVLQRAGRLHPRLPGAGGGGHADGAVHARPRARRSRASRGTCRSAGRLAWSSMNWTCSYARE